MNFPPFARRGVPRIQRLQNHYAVFTGRLRLIFSPHRAGEVRHLLGKAVVPQLFKYRIAPALGARCLFDGIAVTILAVSWQGDYREMLREPDIELVTLATPNFLHCAMAIDCAAAGKHMVCEKPLAMTLEEGEEMVQVAKRHGVLLLYAEELFFTPKYVKAKEMADAGAFGKIYLVKQSEKHFGPHSAWFWDVEHSGGGVFMDMGCHGIAFCYWFLGRPAIQSIYCQMGTYVHGEKTRGEDNSHCLIEFANGAVGLVEDSWARRGGMDDRIEVYGEGGVTYANLHMGNAVNTRGMPYLFARAVAWPGVGEATATSSAYSGTI